MESESINHKQNHEDALQQALDLLTESGLDVLVYKGPISYKGFDRVVHQRPPTPNERVLMVLTTPGGDADAAYRIVRFLRKSYETVRVFVPSRCKSAGTLICIAATELAISETGELGPLDVQLRQKNELFGYQSGLAVPQALESLQQQFLTDLRTILLEVAGRGGLETEMAAKIAVSATVGLYQPIYSQIEPHRVGEDFRALAVARDYAARFAENLKPGALEELVLNYSSHSFAIDDEEARTLFNNVTDVSKGESDLARALGLDYTARAFSESGETVTWYPTIGLRQEVRTEGNDGGQRTG